MEIYKKISEVKKEAEVDDLKMELEDRFGPLPKEAHELLEIAGIKLLCQEKEISKLSIKENRLRIEFDQNKKVGKEEIMKYREGLTYPMEFFADENLKMEISLDSTQNRLEQTKKVLQKL